MTRWFAGWSRHGERCFPWSRRGNSPVGRQGPGSIHSALSLVIFILCIVANPILSFGQTASDVPELKQSGTVEIEQVQVAFLYSGNLGGGRLHYQSRTYEFTIGGLGVGGFGVSKIEAIGEVYNLNDLGDFPGAYGQARYGYAVETESAGELWLQNAEGVRIRLDAKRKGLALSVGADAIYIGFN